MEKNIRTKVGQRIRSVRLSKHLTQEKLAQLVGIDYKYLQKIEGKTPPAIRIDTLEKIAKALKIPVSELFNA